jgi:3-mercaptopyruvate sulfurtransferase SseA
MRLLLSITAALGLGLVLLVAAACNPEAYSGKANANGTAKPGVASAPPAVPAAPTQPADSVRRVTIDELKTMLAENKAVVVDVRGDAAFKTGHIKGALMIPAAEIDKHADELPKDKLIVTYCS